QQALDLAASVERLRVHRTMTGRSVDGSPTDASSDRVPDSAVVCTPACGAAMIQYPDGAPPVSQSTSCVDGSCGAATLDNRSGQPSSFTRLSCNDLCAMAAYSGRAMQCTPQCGRTQNGNNTVYTFGGGTFGGFSEYLGTDGSTAALQLTCSDVPSAVI